MTTTPDITGEKREKLALDVDLLIAVAEDNRQSSELIGIRIRNSLLFLEQVSAALRAPPPGQSIGEQQILDEANRRYVTDSYRRAFIEGAGWGLNNRAASDQSLLQIAW